MRRASRVKNMVQLLSMFRLLINIIDQIILQGFQSSMLTDEQRWLLLFRAVIHVTVGQIFMCEQLKLSDECGA